MTMLFLHRLRVGTGVRFDLDIGYQNKTTRLMRVNDWSDANWGNRMRMFRK